MSRTAEPGSTDATAPCPRRSTCPRWSARCCACGGAATPSPASLQQTAGGPPLDLLRGPADRQRHARDPPRRGPRLQGRLPPLQDHEGLPRPPQGRLGLPRPAGRARRGEGARLLRQGRHRGVRRRRVQRPLPRVGAAARRRVRVDDRADGLLGGHVHQAYRTMDADYVEAVWWSLQADLRPRACSSRTTGSRPTARAAAPGCPTTSWPRGTRPSSTRRSTSGSRSPAARWPSATPARPCWSGRRRRGRWSPTPPWPSTPTSTTWWPARPTVRALIVAEPLVDGDPRRRRRGPRAAHRRRAGPGTRYAPPFDLRRHPRRPPTSSLAEYVTTEDGSGLVHIAPAFGAEDLAVGREHGLPVVNPITPDGHFEDGLRLVGGVFFKKADAALVDDLRARGLLFRAPAVRAHLPALLALPHRRCSTTRSPPGTSAPRRSRTRCFARTSAPTGIPATIKHGRYGDWLDNNVDWALSRDRYWGTPLPIWRCDGASHLTVRRLAAPSSASWPAGSCRRSTRTGRTSTTSTLPCPSAGPRPRPGARGHRLLVRLRARCRSPSGATRTASADDLRGGYPADFICEAIDQTRGWFYTLMAIGTLVFDAVVLPQRALPRPHPRRGRPQDEQAPRQRARADRR